MTVPNPPEWVMCESCGGDGGRFDATYIEGGCGRCEGRGVVLKAAHLGSSEQANP